MVEITRHKTFADRTRADHVEARFQFGVHGTKRAGVIYVTEKLTADRDADIGRAAAVVAKWAGADSVTIYGIGA